MGRGKLGWVAGWNLGAGWNIGAVLSEVAWKALAALRKMELNDLKAQRIAQKAREQETGGDHGFDGEPEEETPTQDRRKEQKQLDFRL